MGAKAPTNRYYGRVKDLANDSPKLTRIKRYEIVRAIGEGGMGKVYLAMDRIIRRPVAVKVFELERLTGSDMPRERVMRDFFLETQTAGALLHPNIVVVYDVGKKGELLYMVMEFVYGETLLEHQRREGFGMKKAIEIIYELALALDYAHGKGVVHRDIKPENIILSSHGVPKITDFGIARFRKHLKTRDHVLVGSSRFMAPEQILGREQDHRVDIYQLGVVLFELLTKQTPFKGVGIESTLSKICTEDPPPPGRINPEIPTAIDDIVVKCLQKSPAQRYDTAKALADALGTLLKGGMHQGLHADQELVSDLRKFELFSLFTDREIQEIATVGQFVTCKAGEHIIKEEEVDSNFFILLDGNVKVVKADRVLSNFLPGACFGEVGAFARQRRSAGVIAETDCTLLQVNALLVRELDPLLQLKMLHTVVRNLSTLVISLDAELTNLSASCGQRTAPVTVCPLCAYDNKGPLEVCPRCGVIPSKYIGAAGQPLPRPTTQEPNRDVYDPDFFVPPTC
ncbi:MAG: serine/threonine-protein kinase [Pseudomonadota bacterium]